MGALHACCYIYQAGPTGSQFAILACLFVEVIHNWSVLFRPWKQILKLSGIMLVLFIIGLLPFVDNYAQLFGFMYGFLLAYSLMPCIFYNSPFKDKVVIACLTLAILIIVVLIIVFYVVPIHECQYCSIFNCLPFTEGFCVAMQVNISSVFIYRTSILENWSSYII